MSKKKKVLIWVISFVLIAVIITSIWLFAIYLPQVKKEKEARKFLEDYYNAKVEMFAEQNKNLTDYEVDVTFVGDSLTDGYDLEKFYPQYKTLNRGIGGDTTFGVEKRLQVTLYDVKPKVAVMLIGANNIKTMFENYEKILISFKENLPQTKIVLLSLTSMGGEYWGWQNQISAFNNVKIRMLAEKYGFEFIDLYSPLLNLEDNEIYDEYTTDGGHLTTKGYEVITAQITPVLESLLN